MALIIWSNDYNVGVETIDTDHIEVASLINHIHDAKQYGSDETVVEHLVRALIAKARQHFEHEEALLERYGYPELEHHRKEHRVLLEQLDELYEAYRAHPSPDISQEIMELLNYWLVEHILNVDMRYRSFLREAMASDGAPPTGGTVGEPL